MQGLRTGASKGKAEERFGLGRTEGWQADASPALLPFDQPPGRAQQAKPSQNQGKPIVEPFLTAPMLVTPCNLDETIAKKTIATAAARP